MKKAVSLLLALTMVFTLCGCGNSNKKAFEKSKNAYNKINSAYSGAEIFGSAIYEAWYQAINNSKEIEKRIDTREGDNAMKYLASEIGIKSEHLIAGGRMALYSAMGLSPDNVPEDMSEAVNSIIEAYDKNPDLGFEIARLIGKQMNKPIEKYDYLVSATVFAFKDAGITDEIQGLLDESKAEMKELSEKYSDYEHYPNLKGFYTTTNSFFDFCTHPSGSFEQLVETINSYKNEARDYKADLDYIFED